jgi:hypothetical protein
MSYYCHLDSSRSLEYTNLQLYSLQQAANGWNDLIDLVADRGNYDVDHFRERLTFILSCLGLSLSQLLGQNCPSPDKGKMDQPGVLLGILLTRASVDRTTRRRLNNTFQDFLSYYGAIRHFGANKDEQNYRTVDQLKFMELDRFRCMTIEIWDVVIALHRKNKENDIEEFRSVSEVVRFKDLPNNRIESDKV